MKFPWEVVTEVEMHLWCKAVTQVVAAGLARNSLGAFNEEGHRYENGGFKRTLVNYTGVTVKLSRLCNMFNEEDMVHPGIVGPGK
jgi:hypothetical protein